MTDLGSEHERGRRRILGVGGKNNACAGEEGDVRRRRRGGAEVGEGAPMSKALTLFPFPAIPSFPSPPKTLLRLVIRAVDRFSAI